MYRTGTGGYFIETTTTILRFAIIGAGRLGAGLALALRSKGADLVGYMARSSDGRARAETWLGGRATPSLAALVETRPDLYVIAVPDQALPDAARRLGGALGGESGRHPVVVHTSGATSVSALRPCEEVGAATAVFHPLQTFSEPIGGSKRFAGAAVAVTPTLGDGQASAARLCFTVARSLGARPFLLTDDKRSLYHAAATVACNYLVTLEYHAEQLFISAGLPEDDALTLFVPLVEATLENIARQGPAGALTGPIDRGDIQTIQKHLQALESDAPHLVPAYRALGLATIDLVRARDSLDAGSIAALTSVLQRPGPQPSPPPKTAETRIGQPKAGSETRKSTIGRGPDEFTQQ